jgi:hypothetical protein
VVEAAVPPGRSRHSNARPAVGYLPMNPCGEIAGVGTAGFGIGGPANFGPHVMPATYSVALVSAIARSTRSE